MVDKDRVERVERARGARAIGGARARDDRPRARHDELVHLRVQIADRSLESDCVGNHIRHLAAVDHGDREDSLLTRVDVSAHHGLERHDHVRRGQHRIHGHVRLRAVATLAGDHDLE